MNLTVNQPTSMNFKAKLDPKVALDYAANVLPKKAVKLPLNELDKAVEKAVECANSNNEKGLKSAMELNGRLMANKK